MRQKGRNSASGTGRNLSSITLEYQLEPLSLLSRSTTTNGQIPTTTDRYRRLQGWVQRRRRHERSVQSMFQNNNHIHYPQGPDFQMKSQKSHWTCEAAKFEQHILKFETDKQHHRLQTKICEESKQNNRPQSFESISQIPCWKVYQHTTWSSNVTSTL